MNCQTSRLVILWFFFVNVASAHPGGHTQQNVPLYYATWTCKDGTAWTGNISMSRNDSLFLIGKDDRLFAIPLQQLTEKDQRLAKRVIYRHEALNQHTALNVTIQRFPLSSEMFSSRKYTYLFLIIILIAALSRKWNRYRVAVGLAQRAWIAILALLVIYACKKESGPADTYSTVSIPKTSIGFLDSAFSAFKPSISTSSDNTYYYVSSTGIPNHNLMIGITSWQQQVPITQPYSGTNSWSIPLQPTYAEVPLSTKSNFMKGAVAIAVNGIPIFNALNNRGEDSYAIGELDNWGGHCGRADDYHYHAAPMHLSTVNSNKPIAFALDGFPIYGMKEADGSSMLALDSCHGHVLGNSVYHYHGTTTYPYVIGAMKGKVILDPATPAPENQILPQAFAKAARPATSPLRGATITSFAPEGQNGYLVIYSIGSKTGSVRYSWDAMNKYTYTLTDTSGVSTTTSYQRN